jgi:alpha-mannosidase
MNNYWETNYKASQEGATTFRYSLLPHGAFDAAAATRFGIARSQPLVVVPVDPQAPLRESMLRVEPDGVIVTSLKPSIDGRALMLRLWNASDQPAAARVTWIDPVPQRVAHSSPFEEPGEPVGNPLELAPKGIVTLRADIGPRAE